MRRVDLMMFMVLPVFSACGSPCPDGTYPVGDGACALLASNGTEDPGDGSDPDDAPADPEQPGAPQPPVPEQPGGGEQATSGTIVVINDTLLFGITQLDVQPCNNGQLGDWDYLNGYYLDDGLSFSVVELDWGCYDILAYDGNAFAIWTEYGVQLHAGNPTFTFTLLQ